MCTVQQLYDEFLAARQEHKRLSEKEREAAQRLSLAERELKRAMFSRRFLAYCGLGGDGKRQPVMIGVNNDAIVEAELTIAGTE